MSEVSALAQEYRVASELSETMNRALIGVKKASLDRHSVDAKELQRAKETLADIVKRFIEALDSASSKSLPTTRGVPGAVTTTLARSHSGDLTYFMEDLRKLETGLQANGGVGDKELRLLDELLAAVDNETALVFRRLMRK